MKLAKVTLCLLVFAVGSALGFYLTGGSRVIIAYLSPDKKQRLEIALPPRWQQIGPSCCDFPAVARVTRLADGTSSSTSAVFELSGAAPVYWSPSGVQVSTAAIYDRATDRWTVEQ